VFSRGQNGKLEKITIVIKLHFFGRTREFNVTSTQIGYFIDVKNVDSINKKRQWEVTRSVNLKEKVQRPFKRF